MHSYKYRLRDIQEEYLPEITEKKEKKKTHEDYYKNSFI